MWSAFTSGIEPPLATRTVAAPQAARQRVARRPVGRPARARREAHCRSRSALTFSAMPNGRTPSRCRTSGALRLQRVLLRVHAQVELGPRRRRDRVERAGHGRHVDARDGDRRPRPDPRAEPAGAEQRQPLLDLGQRAELVVAVGLAGPLLAPQPLDRDVAVLVVQASTSACSSAISASGAAPPYCPLCLAPASVRSSTVTSAIPRSATVSVGTPGPHAAHVGDQHRVRAEHLGIPGRVGVERAADLLLALDHELDADRRLAVERAQRADVHHHVGLGVRAAAAVERAVALGRLERRRAPQRLVAGGHDVVVRVQQHGRRAGRRRDLADDDRRGVGQRERLDLRHAGVAQQLGDDVVRLAQRLRRMAGNGDRGDAHESLEVGAQLGHQPVHDLRLARSDTQYRSSRHSRSISAASIERRRVSAAIARAGGCGLTPRHATRQRWHEGGVLAARGAG